MDNTQAQAWLDGYIEAWRSYDPAQMRLLFSDNVEYSYNPYHNPLAGVDAVIDSWLDDRDDPDSWEASYAPYAVDGDRLVAAGWSRYLADDGHPERLFHNCFLIEFDHEGKCRKFTEFFMKEG